MLCSEAETALVTATFTSGCRKPNSMIVLAATLRPQPRLVAGWELMPQGIFKLGRRLPVEPAEIAVVMGAGRPRLIAARGERPASAELPNARSVALFVKREVLFFSACRYSHSEYGDIDLNMTFKVRFLSHGQSAANSILLTMHDIPTPESLGMALGRRIAPIFGEYLSDGAPRDLWNELDVAKTGVRLARGTQATHTLRSTLMRRAGIALSTDISLQNLRRSSDRKTLNLRLGRAG